jgi:cell shape-determining protein MreC
LIEAVKELKNENNDLKALRNENKDLKNRLEKIEEILSLSASKK